VRLGLVVEARHERIEVGVGLDLGGIDVELFPPDQARLLAEVDDFLEEALEDVNPQALPNPGQPRVIRQILIQSIAEVPAVGQVEAGHRDELTLRPNALEEHHELQLEEHDRIDAGSAPLGIEPPRPLPHEAEIELRLQVPVEVVLRDQAFEGDGDRLVEAAGFGRAEHRGLRGKGRVARTVVLLL
jgi:hypothetical protein